MKLILSKRSAFGRKVGLWHQGRRQHSVHSVLGHCRFLKGHLGNCTFFKKGTWETADFWSIYRLDTVLSESLRRPWAPMDLKSYLRPCMDLDVNMLAVVELRRDLVEIESHIQVLRKKYFL